MLLQRAELLVLDRDRAGQPHARLILGFEFEIGNVLADCIRCNAARFKLSKVEDGLIRMNRRNSPAVGALRFTSSRHEKLAGFPAAACSNVVANIVCVRVMSSSVYIFRCSPARPKVSACTRPRRLGSVVQHLKQRLRPARTGWRSPAPPRSRRTGGRCAGRTRSRSATARFWKSAAAPATASGGRHWPSVACSDVGALITAKMVSFRWGNNRSTASSR